MVSRSMSQVGKWSRRIGGALVLALVGLSAPTTIPGAARAEIIEVHSCAPGWTDIGGTCWPDALTEPGGGSTDPGTNYYPSGGGSGGGGGGGYVPGGGGSGISTAGRAARVRLAAAKQKCLEVQGVWGTAVFKDIVTNIAYAGYSCRWQTSSTQYLWLYYDSEGYVNQVCKGDLDVQICDYPGE